MLCPKELLLFQYFATNHRQITIDEILMKFKKCGDRDTILNLLCTLEELGLVAEEGLSRTWRISDYGKLVKGGNIERLIRA